MGMPNKSQMKRVLREIERAEGTLAKPEHPTALEQFRHDIQQKFVTFKLRARMSQRDMARLLGVDEGKVSKILRNRLSEFSTDRLLQLYEKLDPKMKLKVS